MAEALTGFLEWITRPSVIIRVGPGATAKPAKYQNTLFAEIIEPRRLVEIKGYDQRVEPHVFSAVMRELFRGGFSFARFERFNHRPRTLTFQLGPDGALSMTVEYHPPGDTHGR